MNLLDFIIWSPDPEMFVIPVIDRPVRWYGLLFAMAFLVGQYLLNIMFKWEGRNVKHVDKITIYGVIATVIGARLGHCLFYDPIDYLSNPIKILYVWEGGLASHGAAIAILVSLYMFAKKYKYRYLWVLDRVAIITVLGGMMIRTGNFMNSEIIGKPTESDYGIVFARNMEENFLLADKAIEEVSFEKGETISGPYVPVSMSLTYKRGAVIDESVKKEQIKNLTRRILQLESAQEHFHLSAGENIPVNVSKKNNVMTAEVKLNGMARHPGQLYEALACFVMFLILAHIYYHHRHQLNNGIIFGLFMIMLWAERFLVEFSKENQVTWEDTLPLNMGQWLSIPMFIFGVVILIYSIRSGEKTEQ